MTTPGQQPPQGPQLPPQPPPPGAMNTNDPAFQQYILNGGDTKSGGLLGLANPIAGLAKYTEDYIAASGSGKFSIDPAEIEPLKQQWSEAMAQLIKAQQLAEAISTVGSPADEDASNNMIQGARKSGQAYIDHNQQLIEYCKAEKGKLEKALQAYQQNEEQNAHHVSRHGRS